MKRRFITRALPVLATAVLLTHGGPRTWAAECLDLLLTPFGAAVGGASAVDFLEQDGAAGRLLVSATADGLPASVVQVGGDGSATVFPLPAMGAALTIATVRNGPCLGGFDPGDVFAAGDGNGRIARVTGESSTLSDAWVTLPDLAGATFGGMHQDRACAFDGDLLVTTNSGAASGRVWRITVGGAVTLVATLDAAIHGIVTLPNDAGRYGPAAGRALVGAANGLYAVDPGGDVVTIGASVGEYRNYGTSAAIAPASVDVVPKPRPDLPGDGDFVGVNRSNGRLLRGAAAAFACHCGDVLLTQAQPEADTSGLSILAWNGTGFDVTAVGGGTTAGAWGTVAFAGGADCRTCSGVVGNHIWRDLNGDGVRDASEPGLSGVTVMLTRPDVPAFRSTTRTGADGRYEFTGLCAGAYVVTVVANARLTEALEGSDRSRDSNVNGTPVSLATDGDSDLTIGFGFK